MMRLGKISILAFVVVLFMGLHAYSQNSVVSNAIQFYHDGNYEKAYELAGDALVHIDALSGDYIPAAFYYLGKSRMQILRIALQEGDKERLEGMHNALMECYYDYSEAMKTADSKLSVDIQRDLADLYNPILQTGLSALNTAKNTSQPANVRQSALEASLGYLNAAKDINQTYLVCDLVGQALMMKGDSITAHENFGQSIAIYRERPSTPPDFLMGYVYFRKAMIERYFIKNNNKAIVSLMEGQNLLNTETARYGAVLLSKEEKRTYDLSMMDLIGFELDIYLGDSTFRDEALVRFQEVMILYPEDYDIHISYANLLEDVDQNLAIDAYETAISLDDSKELAYFNLGALYNNIGSEYYLKGLNQDDDIVADSLYNEANNYFRQAYLNMEEAYKRNPESIACIRALVQISTTLGLEDRVEFYKRKEMEMRGF